MVLALLRLAEAKGKGFDVDVGVISGRIRVGRISAHDEIPSAVDLWATMPTGHRVIFEVKTLSGGNEVSQCRSGLSQLLEYRFFWGRGTDTLCLVLNAAITDRRRAFLEDRDIAIVRIDDSWTIQTIGGFGAELFE